MKHLEVLEIREDGRRKVNFSFGLNYCKESGCWKRPLRNSYCFDHCWSALWKQPSFRKGRLEKDRAYYYKQKLLRERKKEAEYLVSLKESGKI